MSSFRKHLDAVYWRLYFDIYSQIQDVQLLSKLSLNTLRKHFQHIQHLTNEFDWFIEDYLREDSILFTNDDWINSMVDLRRYLEKSRIMIEFALDQVEHQHQLIDNEKLENNIVNENENNCYQSSYKSYYPIKDVDSNSTITNENENIKKPIIQKISSSSSLSSVSVFQQENNDNNDGTEYYYNGYNNNKNDDKNIQKRNKNPMQVFDENGQAIDLQSLSLQCLTKKNKQQHNKI